MSNQVVPLPTCSYLFLLFVLVSFQNVNCSLSPNISISHESLSSLTAMERSNIIRVKFVILQDMNKTAVKELVHEAIKQMQQTRLISENSKLTFLSDVRPDIGKFVNVYFFIIGPDGKVVSSDAIIREEGASFRNILEDLIGKQPTEYMKIEQGPEKWDPPVPYLLLSMGLGILVVVLVVLGMWIFRMFDPKKPSTMLQLRL